MAVPYPEGGWMWTHRADLEEVKVLAFDVLRRQASRWVRWGMFGVEEEQRAPQRKYITWA